MENKIVYVVDDQVGIRLLLREIIASHGYEVREFDTGKAALNACSKEKPALLFIDYQMPQMNGKQVAEELMATLREDVPVCFMSGYSEDDIDEDLPRNVKKFLQKPFDVTEIKTILDNLI